MVNHALAVDFVFANLDPSLSHFPAPADETALPQIIEAYSVLMPKDHDPRAIAPQTEPHPVDIHVGSKIKLRRKLVGLSQSSLAEHVGKTFQQFQKYETGKNRISASVLFQVAQALRTPIDYFFDIPTEEPEEAEHSGRARSINDFLRTAEGVELASLYPRIKNYELRRRIVALITAMADEE